MRFLSNITKNKNYLIIGLFLLFTVLFLSCTSVDTKNFSYLNDEIKIKGLTEDEFSVSIDELSNLSDVKNRMVTGLTSKGKKEKYKGYGPTLNTFLKKYNKKQSDFNEIRFLAKDDFAVTIPKNIIDSKDIILSIAKNGKALSKHEAPLRSLIDGERTMYWVRLVEKIEFSGVEHSKTDEVKKEIVIKKDVSLKTLSKKYGTPKKSVLITAEDGLEKTESVENFLKGKVSFQGKNAPLLTFESKLKGMQVKRLKSIQADDILYIFRKNSASPLSFLEFSKEDHSNDKTIKFLYFSDAQYELYRDKEYKKFGDLLNLSLEKNKDIDFAISGGDMVNEPDNEEDWATFFKYANPFLSKVNLAPVPGNHETYKYPKTYTKKFDLPRTNLTDYKEELYSFDYGDAHFLMLNSNLFLPEREEALGKKKYAAMMKKVSSFIKNDLKKNAKWKIVTLHHPPFPVSEDGNEVYKEIRESWVPLFEKYKVNLILTGHQHVYMRTKKINGIVYIMSRAGGKDSTYSDYYNEGDKIPSYIDKIYSKGPTYQIITINKNLIVKSYDEKGSIIDEVESMDAK
ncbi:MAG: metallophosphoesterase [Clostridiales Family XIII bacterium]|jgi:hypothetical protein|nr:metallophosphoesterase [Clostridiales Family XIII bacterium]